MLGSQKHKDLIASLDKIEKLAFNNFVDCDCGASRGMEIGAGQYPLAIVDTKTSKSPTSHYESTRRDKSDMYMFPIHSKDGTNIVLRHQIR